MGFHDGDVALTDVAVSTGRELAGVDGIEHGFEDSDYKALMAAVLNVRRPRYRTLHDGVASLCHPFSVGSVDSDPRRKESEAIGQVNPGRADEVGVSLGDAKAGIEPIELDAGSADGSLAEIPQMGVKRIRRTGLCYAAECGGQRRGSSRILAGDNEDVRRFPERVDRPRTTISGRAANQQIGKKFVLARPEGWPVLQYVLDLSFEPRNLSGITRRGLAGLPWGHAGCFNG